MGSVKPSADGSSFIHRPSTSDLRSTLPGVGLLLLGIAFLVASPVALVSCSGGGDTEATAEKKKSRGPSDSALSRKDKTANKLRRQASKLGAKSSRAYKNAYRALKAGRKLKDDGDNAAAGKKFDAAEEAFEKLVQKYKVIKKQREGLAKLEELCIAAKTKADSLEAKTLASEAYEAANEILVEAMQASESANSQQAIEEAEGLLEEAAEEFGRVSEVAAANSNLRTQVLAELDDVKKYKAQALEAGADKTAITEWAQAEQHLRKATVDIEKGLFDEAINGAQQASAGFISALESIRAKAESERRQEEYNQQEQERIAREAELEEKRLTQERELLAARRTQSRPTVDPYGGSNISQGSIASAALSALATEWDAEWYTQELSTEDEEYLQENWQKLSKALTYDPQTGVAQIDYVSGNRMLTDMLQQSPKLVRSLRSKKFLSFKDFIAGGGADGDEILSFQANTRGAFTIRVPFKYRVRVEFNLSIQVMDPAGKFSVLMMYDPRKKSHYVGEWLNWKVAPRGRSPKMLKPIPDREKQRSPNYWFDKTRTEGVPLRYEFAMPGIEPEEPDMENITETAKLTCIYDLGIDESPNEYISKDPLQSGGFVGFSWNRAKFQVKKLRISGLLDKQLAVDLLRSKDGTAKKRTKKRGKKKTKKSAADQFGELGGR